jgi:hypothetical protein
MTEFEIAVALVVIGLICFSVGVNELAKWREHWTGRETPPTPPVDRRACGPRRSGGN